MGSVGHMPRFFLKVTKRETPLPNDPEPEEFPDLETARRAAAGAIREMASEALRADRKLDIEAIDITDEWGKVLVSLPISEALVSSEPFASET